MWGSRSLVLCRILGTFRVGFAIDRDASVPTSEFIQFAGRLAGRQRSQWTPTPPAKRTLADCVPALQILGPWTSQKAEWQKGEEAKVWEIIFVHLHSWDLGLLQKTTWLGLFSLQIPGVLMVCFLDFVGVWKRGRTFDIRNVGKGLFHLFVKISVNKLRIID